MPADLPQFSAGLGDNSVRSFPLDGPLRVAVISRFGFDCHWLHEVVAGALPDSLGLIVDSGSGAALNLTLASAFLASVSLDSQGCLRLRIFKRSDSAPGFPSNLVVSAEALASPPEAPEELVLAILGVHGVPRFHASEPFGLESVRLGLASLAAFGALDAWLKRQLNDVFGGIASETDLGRALRSFDSVLELARSIHAKALAALEKRHSAELSYRYASAAAGEALLDCSFDFTAEGQSAYRNASVGDFSFLGAPPSLHVRRHPAVLTDCLSRQVHLELHLPFLRRKQWRRRSEALASVEIETGEDGRLFVFLAGASDRAERKSQYQGRLVLAGSLLAGKEPRFTLSYTDRRSLSAAQARLSLIPLLNAYGFETAQCAWPDAGLQSSLTLSIPGSLAAAWLRAPGERDTDFFPVYSAVSVAVQRALRRWLPYVYFSDIDRYDDLGAAFPLVVYQSMRPFPGRPRSEFTYALLSPNSPALEGRTATRALVHELSRISQLLVDAGKKSTARFYAPDQARSILASVQCRPRLLNSLLAADAFFLDSLVSLGLKGRELSQALPREPRKALKDLTKFSSRFVATFHRRLRRLYHGRNFVPFGSLLLVEATRALGAALDGDATVSAVLHLTLGPNRQTLVNPGYSSPPFRPIYPLE
ncbi:MAG: hypothetical protein ABSH05_19160 [Bryobacteraceae bacterium]|jgi:hypothetical protein